MGEDWRIEKQKLVKKYHAENKTLPKGGIVFTGSSLMEMFPIEEWVTDEHSGLLVYNRAVGGYTTKDLLPILDICVYELAPKKVFINIGTNDLSYSDWEISDIMERYDQIISEIEERVPGTLIYMMAYYPVNPLAASPEMADCLKIRTNEKINKANREVRRLAEKHHQRYIDISSPLKDDQGNLKAEYTIEGMHINRDGYRAIFPLLMEYVKE